MPDTSLAQELGVRVPDLIAGFCGGMANAFVFRRTEPWAIVGSIIVGTVTAAYLTDPLSSTMSHWFGLNLGQGGAFVVGLGGMSFCQGILAAIKRLQFGKGGPGGGSADA